MQGRKRIQDVQTHWNSTLDMVERLLEQTPAVHAALSDESLNNAETQIFVYF